MYVFALVSCVFRALAGVTCVAEQLLDAMFGVFLGLKVYNKVGCVAALGRHGFKKERGARGKHSPFFPAPSRPEPATEANIKVKRTFSSILSVKQVKLMQQTTSPKQVCCTYNKRIGFVKEQGLSYFSRSTARSRTTYSAVLDMQ